MSATMTTKDNFPVIDITHKPKRMQGDNLKAVSVMTTAYTVEQDDAPMTNDIPATPTLERAIEYYETHAVGEFRLLYLQTAKWLKEYMTKNIPVQQEVPVETRGNVV